jgi:DNA-binding transcriptional MocR family regulator
VLKTNGGKKTMAEKENILEQLKGKIEKMLKTLENESVEAEEEEEEPEEEKEEKCAKKSEFSDADLEKAIELCEKAGYVVGIPADEPEKTEKSERELEIEKAMDLLESEGYVVGIPAEEVEKKSDSETAELVKSLKKELESIKATLDELKSKQGVVRKSVDAGEKESIPSRKELTEKLFEKAQKGEIPPEVVVLYESTGILPETIKTKLS